MTKTKSYGGLDAFRLVAALLVVCIHTGPLTSLDSGADFLLTRVAARTAVPFFLMVTGFFVLPRYLYDKSADRKPLLRFIKKTALLYAAAAAVYLPVGLYAGLYRGLGVTDVMRLVLFDGTFYHLWYLPASILGALIVVALRRILPPRGVFAAVLALYGLGLLGDSYYGALSGAPVLSALYGALFHVFSYTRNGIFYAPVFLAMGALLAQKERPSQVKVSAALFSFFLILMAAEGLILSGLGWQRHDSMYLMLPPCMYFLFRLVLTWDRRPDKSLRTASTLIYIVHPLFIVAVRAAAKLTGTVNVLVENSLVHFLAVAALSAGFSVAAARIPPPGHGGRFHTGRAWIELDRAALRGNVEALRALLRDGCELMPAVKADAYGHGAVLIARELNKMGVRAFCVASVMEGVALRRRGVRGEILILGYTHPEQFRYLRRCRLTQAAIDRPYAELLNGYGRKLRVHIALDTGMHRLGERCERLDDICQSFHLPNLKITGIYTHLCTDDSSAPEDRAYTLAQGRAFYNAVSQLEALGCACPKIHLQASYGILNYPGMSGDYVRAGIALYGVLGTRADTEGCAVPLQPVLSVKARIAAVKTLYAGESAGYGLQFTAARDTRLAVLAIGYADGLPRALSCGVGRVLINGCAAPIIGRICMDQTLADVSGIPDVKSGDIAVVIGQSGGEEISACDLAERCGTISNEILSRLGARLDRFFV